MSSLPRGVWASRSALLGVVISDDILVNVLVLDKLQDSQNFIGAVACCKLCSQTKWMDSSHQFNKCIAITKVLCKKHFVSMTLQSTPVPCVPPVYTIMCRTKKNTKPLMQRHTFLIVVELRLVFCIA